jgi:magnesium-transporting ATPase (P-type)
MGKQSLVRLHHRFPFRSEKKRMSVVAIVESKSEALAGHYLFLKGAPEVVRERLASVPAGFEEVFHRLARSGKRVLALAQRRLETLPSDVCACPQSSPEMVWIHQGSVAVVQKELVQEELEQALTFLGFVVMEGHLKPDSARVVQHLQKSDHRVVMITGIASVLRATRACWRRGRRSKPPWCVCSGDNELTAAFVAKEVGILQTDLPILRKKPTAPAEGGAESSAALVWLLPDGSEKPEVGRPPSWQHAGAFGITGSATWEKNPLRITPKSRWRMGFQNS